MKGEEESDLGQFLTSPTPIPARSWGWAGAGRKEERGMREKKQRKIYRLSPRLENKGNKGKRWGPERSGGSCSPIEGGRGERGERLLSITPGRGEGRDGEGLVALSWSLPFWPPFLKLCAHFASLLTSQRRAGPLPHFSVARSPHPYHCPGVPPPSPRSPGVLSHPEGSPQPPASPPPPSLLPHSPSFQAHPHIIHYHPAPFHVPKSGPTCPALFGGQGLGSNRLV